MEELMKKTKAGQSAPASETEPKKKFGLPKSKKAKKWMKIAIAAVVIAAVAAGCMARASKKANAYLGGTGHPAGSDAVRYWNGDPEARRFL